MKYKNVEKSFNQKRNVLGKVLPLSTPYTVLIDISDMCNLRCNYCFRYDDSIEAKDYRKNRLMSWETFKKVIEQIKEFPDQIKRISLSNHGEPLCNRLLPEMIKYIKESGLSGKTEIHTNAVLLDEEYVMALCASEIDRVVISIQGINAQSYEQICGVKIDFNHLVEMISLFYHKKTNTQICVKIVDVAIGDKEDEFYEIFSPIADRVFVERVVPLWTGENLMDKNSVSNKYGDLFEVQQCCPLIFYTINILSDGMIYPCSHIAPPFKLGSVYDTTIKKAWESDQRKVFLKKMLTDSRFANGVCKNCFVPQNTVMTKEDSIDFYRSDILKRM